MTDIDIAAIEARPSNIRAVLSWLSDYMTLTVDQRETAAIAITDLLAERTALIERAEKAEHDFRFAEVEINALRIRHVEDEFSLQSAQTEIERLRATLKPFAASADELYESDVDHRNIWEHPSAMVITAGDLRRACAELANPPGDTP